MRESLFEIEGTDGRSDFTDTLAEAIAGAHRRGGGTVRIGAGTYRTGPVRLLSNVTLDLDAGARLVFDPAFDRYPPVFTRWEGVECYAAHPLVYADNQTNVSIRGEGVLDGQGSAWWAAWRDASRRAAAVPKSEFELRLAALNRGFDGQPSGGGGRELQFLRPPLIQFRACRDVTLEGVTLVDSPFWNAHVLYCDGVRVSGVGFRSPADAPNTDGLDIDSSRNVFVSGCSFDVGDDCICLKAGAGEDGLRVGQPTENVIITGCVMQAGHGGVVIGSETAGGVRDVVVSDCIMRGTDRGIRIKSRRGRGGVIENLSFANIVVEDSLCPLVINSYYSCGARPEEADALFALDAGPVRPTHPLIRGITVAHLQAGGCRASAGFIVGLPERPIENLLVTDCRISCNPDSAVPVESAAMVSGLPPAAARGIRVRHVRGACFRNVVVSGIEGESILREDGADILEGDAGGEDRRPVGPQA